MSDELNSTARARGRTTQILLAAALIVGSIAIYYPALRGGFIWDDDVHFTSNRVVMAWKGLIDIWTTRHAVYYPLVLTSGWALHKLVGFNPLAFHLLTLAFHVASALLLVVVLRRFRVPGAWLAGFLFAWHPMQVESAAWVTELKNTQSTFFMLLSVLGIQLAGFFERPFPATPRQKQFLRLSVFLFVLAVLSKTSVVMLPVVLAAMAWWTRGVRKWMDIDALFPFFLVAILGAAWTIWEQRYSSGAFGFEWSLSFIERVVLSGQIVWFYLLKALWPVPVMFLYPKWELDASAFASYLPVLAVIAVAGVLVAGRRTWGKVPALVLFLYGVMIFPLIGFFNVYFMRYAWVADHFAYLALIPVFAGIGAVAAGVVRKNRVAGIALSIAVVTSCGWLSHQHARTFADAETLWRNAIERNPTAWMAHNNLGLLHLERGENDEARNLFEESLRHNPDHYEAMNNLGTLHQRLGDKEKALSYYDAALSLRPELYHSWINRGSLLRDLGDTEGAFASFDRAVELRPDYEAAWGNMAMLAEAEGDGERAYRAYFSLLKSKKMGDEEIGGFLYERAYALASEGKGGIALSLLDRASDLAPGLADVHLLAGILHEHGRDYDRAEKEYRIAMSMRRDWGAVIMRLARLLAASPDDRQRKPREALAMTEAMIEAGGDRVPEIANAHAIALAANGRYEEAARIQADAASMAADPNAAAEMLKRRDLFASGQPYRLPEGRNP